MNSTALSNLGRALTILSRSVAVQSDTKYGFVSCPCCTWIVNVNKTGKLARHGNKVTGTGLKATCPGSGVKVR